jgi:nucleolysin TIA-1/TIAR
MSYEEIFAQTPLYNTTVCISHLPKQAIKQDVASHLQQYGVVSDIFMKGNKAIVKLDTHANAATAIFALQGIKIASKNVRLNWAKDRIPQRVDSQDSLQRSFNVFSSGYIPPRKLVHQITNTYDNHTTMRPPAPTSDPAGGEPGGGLHGWNQYYQQYYSAGHLSI